MSDTMLMSVADNRQSRSKLGRKASRHNLVRTGVEDLDFIAEAKPRTVGVSSAIVASLVLHALFIIWIAYNYHPVTATDHATPIVRYVELMRQNPREFTEAPGPKVDRAPVNAPWSDANRKASMPKPTGDAPTTRPGDGRRIYTPPMPSGDGRPAQPATPAIQQSPSVPSPQTSAAADAAPPQTSGQSPLVYRPQQQTQQAAAGAVDWRSAIREVGKVASLGTGQQGIDLGNAGGGEKGFAESGPISFETQWYDWGEYAQSMVSRIRVNWYEQMPPLIRTGLKGVVTIRFTIQRDGRITDITILDSSTVPPYDFAARKAIELSSPLNPLPKDFPNDHERVTAMFYYNLEPPQR